MSRQFDRKSTLLLQTPHVTFDCHSRAYPKVTMGKMMSQTHPLHADFYNRHLRQGFIRLATNRARSGSARRSFAALRNGINRLIGTTGRTLDEGRQRYERRSKTAII